jgi:hypothetical protein
LQGGQNILQNHFQNNEHIGNEISGILEITSVGFFWDSSYKLAKCFQGKKKKKIKEKIFSPFLEIKIIELATSRRRHFLGRHM